MAVLGVGAVSYEQCTPVPVCFILKVKGGPDSGHEIGDFVSSHVAHIRQSTRNRRFRVKSLDSGGRTVEHDPFIKSQLVSHN